MPYESIFDKLAEVREECFTKINIKYYFIGGVMKYLRCISILTLAVICHPFVESQIIKNSKEVNEKSDITVTWAQRAIQGFNMRVWLSNQMTLGLQAWDCGTGDCIPVPPYFGLEYPTGSGVEHLYGTGPRIGTIIDDIVHVIEGYNGWDARKEMLPEYRHLSREVIWRTSIYDSIGEPNKRGYDDDNDGKIDEDDLDGTDNDGDWNPETDDVGSDGLADQFEMSCDGHAYDSITNPDPAGDNYEPSLRDKCHPNPDGSLPFKNNRDIWLEKNGIPDHGEPNVDEDYAAISYNDLSCSAIDTFTRPVLSGHIPIGLKVIQKSYAWNTDVTDAIIFVDYSYINMGRKIWQDTYLGFYADMDVGPINVNAWFMHNYSAYDSLTRTAYIDNPIDTGSTPLGVTILGTSKPFDSLQFVYTCGDFDLIGDPGTNDSTIYAWMNCSAFEGQCISPNQSPTIPKDTRFFFSFGEFDDVNPGDTLISAYALVSGMNVDDMLNNARRAHRIFRANGFIMLTASISDSGSGGSILISWNRVEKSPDGIVTSYRSYHGTASGQYTDSITTSDTSVIYTGLSGIVVQYFAVAAIDDKGNLSALSDEMSNIPHDPMNLRVYGQQTTINLQWTATDDPDIAGYNVYRSVTPDTIFTRVNSSLLKDTSYFDSDVWGDKKYYYRISSVDNDGNESGLTPVQVGCLIPPATPVNFVIGPGKTYIYLDWSPNTEEDFAGYNIYCMRSGESGYSKLNNTLYTNTYYIDSIGGDFYIEAVDSTDAVSLPTNKLPGQFTAMDQGVLVTHQSTVVPRTWGLYDSLLFLGYKHIVISAPYLSVQSPYYVDDLCRYSAIFWFFEGHSYQLLYRMPIALKGYLLAGGNLLIMGRGLTAVDYPYWQQFLSDIFGINSLLEISPVSNFIGASGIGDFPSVDIDPENMPIDSAGKLGFVERFPNAVPENIIYTYRSSPLDINMEGKPVGLRAVNQELKAYYMSFPIFYLDSMDAKSLIDYVLNDFGVIHDGVITIQGEIPNEFRLYDAYPNPFNPSTTIRIDLPVESDITLVVYDVLGKEVARLIEGRKQAGRYEFIWNANDVSSGVYFYHINAQEHGVKVGKNISGTKKILLMK